MFKAWLRGVFGRQTLGCPCWTSSWTRSKVTSLAAQLKRDITELLAVIIARGEFRPGPRRSRRWRRVAWWHAAQDSESV